MFLTTVSYLVIKCLLNSTFQGNQIHNKYRHQQFPRPIKLLWDNFASIFLIKEIALNPFLFPEIHCKTKTNWVKIQHARSARRHADQLPCCQPRPCARTGEATGPFFLDRTPGSSWIQKLPTQPTPQSTLCAPSSLLTSPQRPNTYSKTKIQTDLLFFAHSSSEINCTRGNWILIR